MPIGIAESRAFGRLQWGLPLSLTACALGMGPDHDWRAWAVLAAAGLIYRTLGAMNPAGLLLVERSGADWCLLDRRTGGAIRVAVRRHDNWRSLLWLECGAPHKGHYLLFADALDAASYAQLRRGLNLAGRAGECERGG